MAATGRIFLVFGDNFRNNIRNKRGSIFGVWFVGLKEEMG